MLKKKYLVTVRIVTETQVVVDADDDDLALDAAEAEVSQEYGWYGTEVQAIYAEEIDD